MAKAKTMAAWEAGVRNLIKKLEIQIRELKLKLFLARRELASTKRAQAARKLANKMNRAFMHK